MENYFKEKHNQIKLWKSFLVDYPAHFHEAVEVIFVIGGTATAYYNGTAFPLSSGSIFFVCPNIIHAYKDRSPDYCHIVLIIDPGQLGEKASSLIAQSIPNNPIWQDCDKSSKLWDLIEIANDIKSSVTQETLTLLLSTIVNLILENIEFNKPTEKKQSIRLILTYCRSRFREPISLKSISEAVNLSESYISHSFSDVLNISLPDYINGLRLNEAVRLLKSTKMNITEIASQSGFPTTRTFNRVFVKQYGISPTKFRKNPKYK